MMKMKIKIQMASAFAALSLLLCGAAQAATHYIRDGGTASTSGTGSCTGWATANACDDLPSTLVRGDTSCMADGSYSGRLFDTPNSGTTLITVRKAVHGDGGCANGANWVSTYGDGQASFGGGFNFSTDYYLIDGATRNESDWSQGSAYGFRFDGIETNVFTWGHASDNVTVKYSNLGPDDGATNQSGYGGAVVYIGGFTQTAIRSRRDKVAGVFTVPPARPTAAARTV